MKLGRIEVSRGFLILLAWLIYTDQQFLLPISAAACLLHELGHYAAIRWAKKDVKTVSITASGVVMEVSDPMNYGQEGIVALAGPGINLTLAFVLGSWGVLPLFCGLNLLLGCFNLLPLEQLDGGRALRCMTALLVSPEAAHRLCKFLSELLTVLLLLSGCLLFWKNSNITLLCVALWQFSTRNTRKRMHLGLVMSLRKR